jgi:hypothetical protein
MNRQTIALTGDLKLEAFVLAGHIGIHVFNGDTLVCCISLLNAGAQLPRDLVAKGEPLAEVALDVRRASEQHRVGAN